MPSWNLKHLLKRCQPIGSASTQSNIASTPAADPVTGVSSMAPRELSANHPVSSNVELANQPSTLETSASKGDSIETLSRASAISSVKCCEIMSLLFTRVKHMFAAMTVTRLRVHHEKTKDVLNSISTGETNTFNTIDIRPRDQPQQENYSVFSVSGNPAGFPIGLTWLDIDRYSDIHINASAETVAPDSVKIHLDASADTVLYSAGCTWLTIYANDRDFQFGNFSTTDDHPWDKPQMQTRRKITFRTPFHIGKPPKVIVWLNELHMSNSTNWRCKAYVTDIKTDSFVIHIDTWASTKLYSATASWIAYPSNCPNISSSSFNTMDVRPWYLPRRKNKGTAKFDQSFEYTPRVLAALNWLDIEHRTNLTLKLGIGDVSTRGLTWHLDAWGDTILYSAGASYIAILDL